MKFKNLKSNSTLTTTGLLLFSENDTHFNSTLEYNNGNIVIKFSHYEPFLKDLEKRVDQIKFLSDTNEILYLINGIITKHTFQSNGIYYYELLFHYMVVDINSTNKPTIIDIEKNDFYSFEINSELLKDLFYMSKFSVIKNQLENDSYKYEINFTPKEKSFSYTFNTENNKITISDAGISHINLTPSLYDLTFNTVPFISYSFEIPLSFKELIKEIFNQKYFFSFLTKINFAFDIIFIKTADVKYKLFIGVQDNQKTKKISFSEKIKIADLIHKNNNLEKLFKMFYIKENLLKDILHSFVNNFYKPIYLDDYLLSQIILIEGVMERTKKKEETLYKTLKAYFKYTDSWNSTINGIMFNEENITFLKEFRHYHSHLYDFKRKPSTTNDIFWLARTLENLMYNFLMKEIFDIDVETY